VVVDGRHQEDPSTRRLEVRHLQDDAHGLDNEDPPENHREQLVLGEHGKCAEPSAERKRAHVAHEHLRRVRVVPKETETDPHHGGSEDAQLLSQELGRIWDAFLRGQVILGGVIFVVVWLGLTVLGVRNALTLGLLSGLLEFIPTLGPIIGTGVAMIVAFFQPTNPWGLESWQFALLVLVLMIVIQQVENNILVPRIVGGALDLHPIIVFVGVLMGAYTWRKLFDLPPFPRKEQEDKLIAPVPVAENRSDNPTARAGDQ